MASKVATTEGDELGRAVYSYLANRGPATEVEVAAGIGAQADGLHHVVSEMLELRLLRRDTDGGRLTAVPPATAGIQVLLPELRQLRERQRAISKASDWIAEMTPVYEASALARSDDHPLHAMDALGDVRQLITELSSRARDEVLTAQPGGARPATSLQESADRTVQLLRRGVRMRTLYQHAAQFDSPTVEHVRLMTRHGAQVRTVSGGFMRLLVFDRETALINLRYSTFGALVIREPSIVGFLAASFENMWAGAAEFPLTYERDQVLDASEGLKQALLRLAAEGHEDKVVAKQLGISLRTHQRHLSELMKRVGARNRLHAGYLFGQLDLARPAREPGEDSPEPQ